MSIMHYQAFISVSMFRYHKCYRINGVKLNLSIHYQNYLFDCYIETFQPHGIFFYIILVFVCFLQTYSGICLFHFHSFYLFLLQISFCVYLLLPLFIFLYHFYNNLLLYLVSLLCSFHIKFFHSFLIYNKKIIKHLFINQIRIVHYANCITFGT